MLAHQLYSSPLSNVLNPTKQKKKEELGKNMNQVSHYQLAQGQLEIHDSNMLLRGAGTNKKKFRLIPN